MNVSKSFARWLKSNGYNSPCDRYYVTGNVELLTGYRQDNNATRHLISAPDLFEVVDWLRLKKKQFISVTPDMVDGELVFTVAVWRLYSDMNPQVNIVRNDDGSIYFDNDFETVLWEGIKIATGTTFPMY